MRPAPSRPFSSSTLLRANAPRWIGVRRGFEVGTTRRRLSFFVMVLCYSRMLYVEFTLAQTQEHFLAAHQHAFEFFLAFPRGHGRQL